MTKQAIERLRTNIYSLRSNVSLTPSLLSVVGVIVQTAGDIRQN
jgi:hypothetical protein